MKELFASADAGTISLLFFFIIFSGVTIWAYRPKNRDRLESYREIPFREDEA